MKLAGTLLATFSPEPSLHWGIFWIFLSILSLVLHIHALTRSEKEKSQLYRRENLLAQHLRVLLVSGFFFFMGLCSLVKAC